MSTDYGFTPLECKIIKTQIERRARYRQEFLKARSDPFKHSKESYFVVDEAILRFMSMKASQLDHFQVNTKTIGFALTVFAPMALYGYAIWTQRQKLLKQIQCGELKYKDRMFKLK